MISKTFIERPILATVVAIVIVLAGLVTIGVLPIEQYPDITPPTIQVSCSYPGADAQTVAQTIATPIEEQVNGVDNMIYMSSVCASDGSYSLTVTFKVGTDPDMSNVLVQNRVAIAESSLPSAVTQLGITTKKKSTNMVLMAALISPDKRYDSIFLSNYATLNIFDELGRLPGVGDVFIFGSGDYSMRIWLDPDALQVRGLEPSDVISAIQEQNVQVAAGKIGAVPAPIGQQFEYTLSTLGRLSDVSEFENIIIKSEEGGRILRLKDVARVELGSQSYGVSGQLGGTPTAVLGVYQLPGANALSISANVREKMEELSKSFPEGLDYRILIDTTEFVSASIDEVYTTLFIAVILVLLVILLFLQDWRATIIPAITIPVSLIGTFAFMALMGFSINMLTLFGLILAIGIVVDDAIVVVENVSRHLETGMKNRKEATILAMKEVTGPIIATTLVLLAVFVPTSFMSGITGEMFQQFALTIAASTVISSINALTLSPALCALFLKPPKKKKFFIYTWFNKVFSKVENGYVHIVKGFVRKSALIILIFLILTVAAGYGFMKLPGSFIPEEDQGYFIVNIQLPDGASYERTNRVCQQLDAYYSKIPGINTYLNIIGYSILSGTSASNSATTFISMKNWNERKADSMVVQNIVDQLNAAFYMEVEEAEVFCFSPPAISGLGTSGGFSFVLQDKGNQGLDELQNMANEISEAGNQQSSLSKLNSTFRANVPQYYLDIDREKAKNLNLSLSSVFDVIHSYLGSSYVNDFNKFGRSYKVYLQADADNRSKIKDITKLNIRNNDGKMVPLGSILTEKEKLGASVVTRYNLYSSATINGFPAAGTSSGQALDLMDQIANEKLPSSFGHEWTSMSYQEKTAGSSTIIFILAFVMVFLVLAAQYESWTSPAAVIMAIPIALLGAVLSCFVRGLPISLYTQIGITLLIALASKNAILIVEFARDYRKSGKSIRESSIEAGRVRFRPILMTSFAFILGTFPLVIASGAAANSRISLGTAVFGGMLFATIVGTIFIPTFYKVMQSIQEGKSSKKKNPEND